MRTVVKGRKGERLSFELGDHFPPGHVDSRPSLLKRPHVFLGAECSKLAVHWRPKRVGLDIIGVNCRNQLSGVVVIHHEPVGILLMRVFTLVIEIQKAADVVKLMNLAGVGHQLGAKVIVHQRHFAELALVFAIDKRLRFG